MKKRIFKGQLLIQDQASGAEAVFTFLGCRTPQELIDILQACAEYVGQGCQHKFLTAGKVERHDLLIQELQ